MINEHLKLELAQAYKILAILGMDDHTYTHLSIRSSSKNDFYIYPFGLRFEEVEPENLMRVSLAGEIIEGQESQYNKTGYMLHGSIYSARPDITAIFHIHSSETVAVSSCKQGLLPISQWALHFYERVSYHDYDSLVLDYSQSSKLILDLDKNFTVFLRNHGVVTCGRTIQETMFYIYHLQKACDTQCKALAMNCELVMPSHETALKSVQDLLSFEKDLGQRDWNAWVKMLNRYESRKGNIEKFCL